MSQLSITVIKEDSSDLLPQSYTLGIEISDIDLIYPETTDSNGFTTDNAVVEYYDDQHMAIRNYTCEETPDALWTAIKATNDTAFNTALALKKFVNTKDGNPVNRLCIVNNDRVVRQLAQGDVPAIIDFDYGLTNHADHVRLEWCDYPLVITVVDFSNNAITVACCVAALFPYDTSISIVGGSSGTDTYTVISSACSTDGLSTVIVLDETLDAATEEGDVVSLS